MKPTQHRTVKTHSVAGIRYADRLKAEGWTCYRTELFLMRFRRKTAEGVK